jgi:hypothetical protein
MIDLSNFKLLKEDDHAYSIQHPNGKALQVDKKGMSAKAHELIKKLKPSGNYADAGAVTEAPQEDASQPATQMIQSAEAPQEQVVSQNPNAELAAPKENKEAPILDPNYYEQEKSALKEKEKAEETKATGESKALEDVSKQFDALPTPVEIQQSYANSNDKLFQAYAAQKIDPDRYWKNQDTPTKVATGLALLLGGIGAGLTHGNNQAAEMIQKSIDRDIDAQKNDQSKTYNLYQMNKQNLGSDLAAHAATENQLLSGLKYKLMQAGANAATPMAKAALDQGLAQISQKQAYNNALLGMDAGLSGKASGSEGDFVGSLNMADRINPAAAKRAREQYVPGVGVAKVPVTPADRESLTEMDNFQKLADKAKNFSATKGRTLNPFSADAQEAKDLMNQGQLSIGKLVGLNRINEFEAKKYTEMFKDPGALNTPQAIKSYEDLSNVIAAKKKAMYQNLGITPFKKSPQEAQALQWAKKNQDDPRAAQILQKLGAK